MLIRSPSADPACSTIGSLGQLQRAFAQLGPNTVQSTRDAGSLTTLQLTTCGAVAIFPTEPSPATRSPGRSQPGAHAALLGMGKVAALEMPSLACAAFDLDIRAVRGPPAHAPAGSGPHGDAHGIAFRGGTCLAPRMQPAPSGAPAHGRRLPSTGLHTPEGAAMQPGRDTVLHVLSNVWQAPKQIRHSAPCRSSFGRHRADITFVCSSLHSWVAVMMAAVLHRWHFHHRRSRRTGHPHSTVACGATTPQWQQHISVGQHCRASVGTARPVPCQPHRPA